MTHQAAGPEHRRRWLALAGIVALAVAVAVGMVSIGGSGSAAPTDVVSQSQSELAQNSPSTVETGTEAADPGAIPTENAGTAGQPAVDPTIATTTGPEAGLPESEADLPVPVPDADGVLPDPVDRQPYEEKQSIPTAASAAVSPPALVPLDEATAPVAAEAALRAFLQLTDQSYQTASVVPGLENVGSGFALGEVQTGAVERWTSGVRQVGGPVLVSVDVVSTDLRGPPPQLTLRACLDSTGVDVLDATGNSLKGSMYNPGRPILNLYGVQHDGKAWKVTTHVIPDDQSACGE